MEGKRFAGRSAISIHGYLRRSTLETYSARLRPLDSHLTKRLIHCALPTHTVVASMRLRNQPRCAYGRVTGDQPGHVVFWYCRAVSIRLAKRGFTDMAELELSAKSAAQPIASRLFQYSFSYKAISLALGSG